MPIAKTLIQKALSNNDQKLSKRLIETLFPVGIFYPEFTLNFIDQHLDLANEQIVEPILKHLGLLVPLYPDIIDSYTERWNFTVKQKDIIYTCIDNERAYKATEYLLVYNIAVYSFLSSSMLTPMGFESFDHFVTSNSFDEAVGKVVVSALKTLRKCKFDLVKLFTPVEGWN